MMKILVCSYIHGNVCAVDKLLELVQTEKPSKTVICGDVCSSRRGDNDLIEEKLKSIDSVLYVIRGNCDYASSSFDIPFEDYAVMYHFGKMLFFTHGHEYDAFRLPPVLDKKGVIVYGHTHTGRLSKNGELFVANVGSLSQPRGYSVKNYLVIDDNGITLKDLQQNVLQKLSW